MRNDCVFFCPIRVRYGEVDQQGVVYNGNYVVYTDVAFEEFLRSKGYPYRKLVNEYASEVCHKKATFEYISSAFEGDMLEVGVRVVKVGNRSFTLGFEIYRQGEEDPLVTSEIVYVGYDTQKRSSRPITELMRKLLGA
ncbi:acyl-CoA thioesterase [Clostridium aminobutyricum]|nr:thioesterase family protein [Clostridium aminobutyricum]